MRQGFSSKLRKHILDRDGNRCQVCHATENLDIDHCLPVCLGGDNNPLNLRVLCHKCNVERNKDIKNYRTRRVSQHIKKAKGDLDKQYEIQMKESRKRLAERDESMQNIQRLYDSLKSSYDYQTQEIYFWQFMYANLLKSEDYKKNLYEFFERVGKLYKKGL